MSGGRPKVHPRYKMKYPLINWPSYDRALRNRGNLVLRCSPSVLRTWSPVGAAAGVTQ